MSWVTASSVLALVAVPVLVVMIAGNHTALPHLNSAYAIVYASSEGELFEHGQARTLLWLDAVFRLVVLVVSVPYWRALKLL